MRGQVAIEYLMMVGVLLVAVAVLGGYSFVMYNETVKLNQVKHSLNDLRFAVNRVHSLGEGNSVIVRITLPDSVNGTRVIGNIIGITANTFGSSTESMIITDANVHGSIPASQGIHYMEVKGIDGNVSLSET